MLEANDVIQRWMLENTPHQKLAIQINNTLDAAEIARIGPIERRIKMVTDVLGIAKGALTEDAEFVCWALKGIRAQYYPAQPVVLAAVRDVIGDDFTLNTYMSNSFLRSIGIYTPNSVEANQVMQVFKKVAVPCRIQWLSKTIELLRSYV